jgi:gamma-glutamyl-gamma-aminobutyrate hydrolase PuuD
MQVLAVASGGKLTHQLPASPINHRPEVHHQALSHTLKIAENSLLHHIAGKTSMRANSHHTEGVVSIGPACTISATAEDNTIEAIEIHAHPFALGVQWHPEHNLDDPQNLAIFQAFVHACNSK